MRGEGQEFSTSGISGLVFVGCLLLGLAIGFLVGNVVVGILGGLGVGFFAMAITRCAAGTWRKLFASAPSQGPAIPARRVKIAAAIRENTTLKAIVYEKYGPPEVLELKEVAKPVMTDEEVLVQVRAASINFGDMALLKGQPFVARLSSGLLKPKYRILGGAIAGRVAAVGRSVKRCPMCCCPW